MKRPLPSKIAGLVTTATLLVCSCGHDNFRTPVSAATGLGVESATRQAASSAVDAKTVRANELGRVPFLMYHRIVPDPQSVYDRSPAQFRAEVERLAAEGYVPVTATEVITGKIDIPAGKHPVVLTFDDGDVSQFSLDSDGQPVKGTAIEILIEIAARNPGFRPVASLYVNANAFGKLKAAESLTWLDEHGFEIGNHTYSHANLSELDDDGAQREISTGDQFITQAIPEYQVSSLALPFGVAPSRPEISRHGSFQGSPYSYDCVLLVGSEPSLSPYDADFDPFNVPRIRSQEGSGEDFAYGSATWLDKLASQANLLYTSDGAPDRISFPSSVADRLGDEFRDQAFEY